MQDAVPLTTDSQQPVSPLELLQKENLQLKDKLAWFETEYNKLAKLMASQNKRIEKHISPGGSPWLPFDSQEELEQAKQEAVYEVNKKNPHRGPLLDMIQGLYDVNAREQGMDVPARTVHRVGHAVPILRVIQAYLDTLTDQIVLPKSDMAVALRYIRNHWEALNLYATDGRIPIDNNRVEQLMREVALGRKNWLFVGNVAAGERAASLMTLVSSAKRHQLDVWMYLKDILDQLLDGETDYSKFAPDVWKAAHPEAVRTYREEESRYKADRKKISRAKRIIAAKQKRERADSQSG